MTRWDILQDLLMLHCESRDAIGKAWPLIFFLVFNAGKENKFVTNFAELKERLNVSPNTLKDWREHLAQNKVVQVFKGNGSIAFKLLSPYDSLVTCEQDDVSQIKIKSDPATKRILDRISSFDNMSLLPVIAEITAKLESLEKKIG